MELKVQPELTRRIIAWLDVRINDAGDLVVIKGDQYDVRAKTGAPGEARCKISESQWMLLRDTMSKGLIRLLS